MGARLSRQHIGESATRPKGSGFGILSSASSSCLATVASTSTEFGRRSSKGRNGCLRIQSSDGAQARCRGDLVQLGNTEPLQELRGAAQGEHRVQEYRGVAWRTPGPM